MLSLDRIPTDEIEATIDYREIVHTAEALAARRIAFIETFAASLAEALLRDPRVRKVKVKVSKPEALASGTASTRVSLKQAHGINTHTAMIPCPTYRKPG